MAIRTAGYYWVMYGQEWEPGFWSDGHWTLISEQEKVVDDDLSLIGPRIVPPNQHELFPLEKPSLMTASTKEERSTYVDDAQQRMEKHYAYTPTDNDWGLFCYTDASPGIGGGVGAFYWFSSRDDVFSFICQVLPFYSSGHSYDNPHLKQRQLGVIVEAIRIGAISEAEGLAQLNKALVNVYQITWWGTLHRLTQGDSPFARAVINAFEAQHTTTIEPPLSDAQNKEWLAFLSEYGL